MLQHIRESNLIENIDDPNFDKQSLIAWLYLSEQKRLTHQVIKKTQKMITLLQDMRPDTRGYYRDLARIDVRVGWSIAPPYSQVQALMDNWLLAYKTLEPIVAHITFEKIHPFVDGNGRTGRMLMWWQELKADRQPTLFLNSEKQDYYKLFGSK
jgi:Fic family protein